MILFRKISRGKQQHIHVIYQYPADQSEDLEDDLNSDPQSHFEETDVAVLGILPRKISSKYGEDNSFFRLSTGDASLLRQEIERYAWERLLKYLTYRERSEVECREYLKQLPLAPDISQDLISRAHKYNYLDDNRFAELLTVSLINRNKSRVEVYTALKQKRIAPEIIQKVLSEHYTTESKQEIIKHHVEKGIRKYPNKNSYKDYQKCIAYLMRKGFAFADIQESVKAYYKNDDDYYV
jgi:regulatory protein